MSVPEVNGHNAALQHAFDYVGGGDGSSERVDVNASPSSSLPEFGVVPAVAMDLEVHEDVVLCASEVVAVPDACLDLEVLPPCEKAEPRRITASIVGFIEYLGETGVPQGSPEVIRASAGVVQVNISLSMFVLLLILSFFPFQWKGLLECVKTLKFDQPLLFNVNNIE